MSVVIWAISFQKKLLLFGPWSLLPKGLLLLVLIFSRVYILPGPYMGGPYKMIMRVCGVLRLEIRCLFPTFIYYTEI